MPEAAQHNSFLCQCTCPQRLHAQLRLTASSCRGARCALLWRPRSCTHCRSVTPPTGTNWKPQERGRQCLLHACQISGGFLFDTLWSILCKPSANHQICKRVSAVTWLFCKTYPSLTACVQRCLSQERLSTLTAVPLQLMTQILEGRGGASVAAQHVQLQVCDSPSTLEAHCQAF